jgi:predicted component of type VI protein secretion system
MGAPPTTPKKEVLLASSKPTEGQISKSRLTSHRTNVGGTTRQENLPFRLLVLGELAGPSARGADLFATLDERHVRSIKRGTTVDDHLDAMLPVWRISKEGPLAPLASLLPGGVTIDELRFSVPMGTRLTEPRAFTLEGKAMFSSDTETNGMCDIEATALQVAGEVTVETDPQQPDALRATSLKVRLAGKVVGDVLDRATNERVAKIVGLAIAGDHVIEVQGAARLTVERDEGDASDASSKRSVYRLFVSPAAAPGSPPAAPGARAPWKTSFDLERALPFRGLSSFAPDSVISHIPELRRVRLLKDQLLWLLVELRSRKELRAKVKELFPAILPAGAEREQRFAAYAKMKEWIEADPYLKLLKLDLAPLSPFVTPPSEPSKEVRALQESLVAGVRASTEELFNSSGQPWAIVRRLPESPTLRFEERNPKITEGARLMNAVAVLIANTEEVAHA